MSYVALYRKFRPDNFGDVKGQDHIVTTLKNQILSGRIGHAYLFCGTRGTGKTTMAKLMARAVNCDNPKDGNPCGECASCKAIAAGASMSVVEIDAASNNGVDNVREIIDEVAFPPADAKYRVYIIDEVHMLSPGAFNALLKTLEEPPSYCIFILATTDPQKIPVTILSRCQRYDFRRITTDVIANRLEELTAIENVGAEPRALRYIAKAADGSMRDALSLLDQCIAFHYGETLTLDMALDVLGAVDSEVFSNMYRKVLDRDVMGCLSVLDRAVSQGRDLVQFVNDFIGYMRNVLIVTSTENPWDILDVSDENRQRLSEEAERSDLTVVMRYIKVFSSLANEIRYSASKRILIETALIRLCKPEMKTDQAAILDRVRALEDKIAKGLVVASAAPAMVDGSTSKEPVKPVELPKALPEDVESVVDNWSRMVSGMEGLLKTMLKGTYPSVTSDNRLKIVACNKLAADKLSEEGTAAELKEVLQKYTGKDIDFVTEFMPDESTREAVSPNLLALKNINADIETENFEEEDYV